MRLNKHILNIINEGLTNLLLDTPAGQTIIKKSSATINSEARLGVVIKLFINELFEIYLKTYNLKKSDLDYIEDNCIYYKYWNKKRLKFKIENIGSNVKITLYFYDTNYYSTAENALSTLIMFNECDSFKYIDNYLFEFVECTRDGAYRYIPFTGSKIENINIKNIKWPNIIKYGYCEEDINNITYIPNNEVKIAIVKYNSPFNKGDEDFSKSDEIFMKDKMLSYGFKCIGLSNREEFQEQLTEFDLPDLEEYINENNIYITLHDYDRVGNCNLYIDWNHAGAIIDKGINKVTFSNVDIKKAIESRNKILARVAILAVNGRLPFVKYEDTNEYNYYFITQSFIRFLSPEDSANNQLAYCYLHTMQRYVDIFQYCKFFKDLTIDEINKQFMYTYAYYAKYGMDAIKKPRTKKN